MPGLKEFKSRLYVEWIEPYCTTRGLGTDGFVCGSLDKLSCADAQDFMYALDHGLVTHHRGTFQTALSKAKEQIFWEGPRSSVPRKFTLWLEPIITIAGLARLQRDFGWEANRLGLQSATWEYDLVGYKEDLETEALVCEVKKSVSEVEKLIRFMLLHLNTAASVEPTLSGAELNAFRKVLALRRSPSTILWVLGPDHCSHVFRISRHESGIGLSLMPETNLTKHTFL